MKKLAIFDFDGTIADTSPGIVNCVRYAQQKMGLPELTYEQMLTHVGPPMEESFAKNFGLSGEKLKQAIIWYKEYACEKGYRELEIYPGIRELLEMLKQKGIYTAIATLKAQTTLDKILEEYGLKKYFDFALGTNTEQPVTKAEMLDKCMEKACCDKENTVLIGDSKYDSEAAQNAGIDFIAVTYGFGFRCAKDAPNAILVCGSAYRIMKYFEIF